MENFSTLADEATIQKTIAALTTNGINAMVVATATEAKEKILGMIPEGAEVMNMASVSLETLGLVKIFNESGKYNAVKPKLMKMDRNTQGMEMKKLGAAPEWAVGSVHAVTEDGHVMIASNTGSQLSGYVYGAEHVVWVVGAQKIVKNLDEGMKRIYDYIVPLEDKHMIQLFGVHTFVSKLLIVNREINPQRITLIFVKESLGF